MSPAQPRKKTHRERPGRPATRHATRASTSAARAPLPAPAPAWQRNWVFLLLLALAAVLAWREETSYDFGSILATGQYILSHHALPQTELFTYTVPNHPYVDLGWLFQIPLAIIFARAGFPGVGAFRVVLVLMALTLMWLQTRRRGVNSPVLLAVGFTLGVLSWEPRFFLRAELMTYLWLAAELYCLKRHQEDGRNRWLYLVLGIQIIWTNSHTLSLFGPAVLGLYALSTLLGGSRARMRAVWTATALSAVTLFINPYGIEGPAFIWNLRTRFEGSNIVGQTITELSSPFISRTQNYWPMLAFKALFVLTALLAVSSALRVRKIKLFDFGLTVVFLILAAMAERNLALFVIATLPVTLESAQDWLDRAAAARTDKPAGSRSRFPVGLAVASAALLFIIQQVVSNAYYVSNARMEAFGSRESLGSYPVACADLIVNRNLEGPIYNEMNWGGYLARRIWPAHKVFISGQTEVMGEEFYNQYLSIDSGSLWAWAEETYHFRLALVSHNALNLLGAITANPNWALVDVDGPNLLYAQKSPRNQALVEEASRRWDSLAAEGRAAPPLVPRRGLSLAQTLFGARHFPWGTWGRGKAFLTLSRFDIARAKYRRALVEAGRDEPALARSYAEANLMLGRHAEARDWYERVLELDPSAQDARLQLQRLIGM